MIYDLAKLSGRNLFRRGKRSWLTVIGIIIGITAIVSLFSLGQGLEQSVTGEFQELGANSIYIIPGSGLGGFFGGGTDAELSQDDLEAVKRAQGVDVAGPLVNAGVQAEFDGETQVITLLGIPTDESKEMIKRVNSIEIASGSEIRDTDRRSGLAGSRLVEGDVFDEEIRRNSQIKLENIDIRIKGLLEETGDPVYDSSVVMNNDAVREIIDDEERIDFIIAEVQSGQSPENVAQSIEDELRDERNNPQGETDFSVSTADDLLNSLTGLLDLVQYVVIGITSIALFVGGLGIMNTMYMSVSERTNEIGIMKALGATKRQILTVYLAESAILGLVGGIIGIILGIGVSRTAFLFLREASGLPLEVSVSPQIIVLSLVSAVLLGVLSGYLPARKAANLEPVEAIRQE